MPTILLEKLSVSDEVQNWGDVIKKQISSQYLIDYLNRDKAERTFLNPFVISLNYSKNPIFGIITNIYVTIYNFFNMEEYNRERHRFHFINKYDKISVESLQINAIILTLYSINGRIDENFFNEKLYHELLHAYQDSLAPSDLNSSSLYHLSIETLDNSDKLADCIVETAKLIYYFNTQEVDAKMQSLYKDLEANKINSENELTKSKVFSDLNYMYEEVYLNCFLKFNEQEQELVSQYFKMTYNRISGYIQKRIKYFRQKVTHVVKLYFTEMEEEINYRNFLIEHNILPDKIFEKLFNSMK